MAARVPAWPIVLLLCGVAVGAHAATDPAERYLAARRLEERDQLAAAREVYGRIDVDRLPPPVARDVRVRRAVLMARTGDCEAARPRLAELAEKVGGHRGAVLEAMAAECAVVAGELDAAAEALRAVVERNARRVDAVAAWIGLAQALAARGNEDEAIAELRALWVARPEHPEAARVAAQLRRLAGGPVELTPEERMDRAERLSRFGRHRDALEELDRAGRPAARELRSRWLHVRGMALYRTRHDYAAAASLLAQAARLGGPTEVEDAFHAARALSRAGRTDEAIRAYRRLVRRHPRERYAATAEYLAAWLELRHGRRGGRRHMAAFVAGPRARQAPDRARTARWQLALADFEAGRHHRAARGFEAYARAGAGAMVRARGLYWRGRALQAAGDRARARDAYRRAAEVEALHYYALLARRRLARLAEEGKGPEPLPPAPAASPPVRVELPAAVRFYARLGFARDARDALRDAEDAVADAAPEGRGLSAVVAAHLELGAPGRAHRLVAWRRGDELARLPTKETRWVWDAGHPRPWRASLEAAAREDAVPPALVHAVMRQESGFEPEAVSYAGAVGLMQLMPATARGLSPEATRRRLFEPRFNIRLGGRLLGRLLRDFDGCEPLAVAAYNAGGHRVRRWLERDGRLPLDHLIERIPIDQTRNYVRRVATHYARYQYLEGTDEPRFACDPTDVVGPDP
ncbi:MAG: transglycosylase SLT domain-containing protein [Myxococcota bacterium]